MDTASVVPARELVPGDIVFLEAGNFIPADVRLLEAVNLRVEEASLTGESLPVQKNAAIRAGEQRPAGRPQEYRLHGHHWSPTGAGAAWSPAPACTPSSA